MKETMAKTMKLKCRLQTDGIDNSASLAKINDAEFWGTIVPLFALAKDKCCEIVIQNQNRKVWMPKGGISQMLKDEALQEKGAAIKHDRERTLCLWRYMFDLLSLLMNIR